MSNREIFQIMHSEKIVAEISTSGQAFIADKEFMPYDLYFEIETDIDSLLNNLVNFYHWCASRVLSLDRKYAKEILNSIGAVQATTDKDRAEIAMSYHCVSLTDVYWVRKKGEVVSFMDINLYKNPLNAAIVDISLRGKQMTVTNQELAPDLSTKGCFPKAWIRTESGFRLLKAGERMLSEERCWPARSVGVLTSLRWFTVWEFTMEKLFLKVKLYPHWNILLSPKYHLIFLQRITI